MCTLAGELTPFVLLLGKQKVKRDLRTRSGLHASIHDRVCGQKGEFPKIEEKKSWSWHSLIDFNLRADILSQMKRKICTVNFKGSLLYNWRIHSGFGSRQIETLRFRLQFIFELRDFLMFRCEVTKMPIYSFVDRVNL